MKTITRPIKGITVQRSTFVQNPLNIYTTYNKIF